jgi:DNA-binding transcriptional MocR family regulator
MAASTATPKRCGNGWSVPAARLATGCAISAFTPVIEPRAGMFLWCTLPDGRDSAELARAALTHGMVLAPGNAFSAAQTAAGFMRFNVAQMEEPSFTVLGQLLGTARR